MERDYDSRKELVEGLKKAAQGNSRNKTARLREIFDEVEAAKESGLSLKSIVAVLADRGLVFDLPTFVNTRHRIKKERLNEPVESCITKELNKKIEKEVNNEAKINEDVGQSENIFHKLSGKRRDGDFNPIPNHKIEIDKG